MKKIISLVLILTCSVSFGHPYEVIENVIERGKYPALGSLYVKTALDLCLDRHKAEVSVFWVWADYFTVKTESDMILIEEYQSINYRATAIIGPQRKPVNFPKMAGVKLIQIDEIHWARVCHILQKVASLEVVGGRPQQPLPNMVFVSFLAHSGAPKVQFAIVDPEKELSTGIILEELNNFKNSNLGDLEEPLFRSIIAYYEFNKMKNEVANGKIKPILKIRRKQ